MGSGLPAEVRFFLCGARLIPFCCHKLGIYARHNEVGNEFASLCLDMNLRFETEEGPQGSSFHPADVLVHGLDGQPLAVDFAVVHTLQSQVKLADVQPGNVARHTESQKLMERQALCLANGWTFAPFVMETVGTWGGRKRRVLQKLSNFWAVTQG